MSFGENESVRFGGIDLELYKGQTDAPFEVVSKGEEPNEYTPRFSAILESNWDNVCKLMDWKKGEAPIDWNLFRVARDPFKVVSSIQNRFLDEGGKLPRYGVDGKFGPETEAALKFVFAKSDRVADTGAVGGEVGADLTEPVPAAQEVQEVQEVSPVLPVAATLDEVAASIVAPAPIAAPVPVAVEGVVRAEVERPVVRPSNESFYIGNLRAAIAVMPRVEERLKAEDLVVDRVRLGDPALKDEYIAAFKERAAKLRDKLILEEPRLKPLGVVVAEIVPFVEAKIKETDFSKINTQADLMVFLEGFPGALEVKMESLKGVLSKEDLEMIDSAFMFKEVDMETLMTFVIASINEFSVSVFTPLEVNSKKFAMLIKTFADENIIDGGPSPIRRVSADFSQKSWGELVKRGIVASGEVNFEQNGRVVAFNLDDLTVSIGGKRAKLVLPSGAKLIGVEALADGSLGLDIVAGPFADRKLLSPFALDFSIGKILSALTGDRVDVGNGAYFEV